MRLIDGWFPALAVTIGVLSLAGLFAGRGRTWWRRRVPLAIGAAATITFTVVWLTNHVWQPFPDPLPPTAVWWLGLTLLAIALAVVRKARPRTQILLLVAAVLVGVTGAVEVNRSFGAYPTLGALLGQPLPHQVDAGQALRKAPTVIDPGTAPLSSSWTAPAELPTHGQVTSAPIPGVKSHFDARDAWIYLPPAYTANPRPLLPVLVLLAGQPGEPRNWFDGPHLAQTMDDFAAQHHGLAPVVVVADWLGTGSINPLCMDSPAGGNDDTYLSYDVPNWIRDHLDVDPHPNRWAIGGLSAGATCALQLATNSPAQYPTFLFFAGQTEPTLSTRQHTIDTLFDGDDTDFAAQNPQDILRANTFPDSAGMFVAGDHDDEFGPATRTMRDAAAAASMRVDYQTVPGGHDFPTWGACLTASMDWLANRLSLT